MDNKNKIDQIHHLMPKFFKTKANPNWKALIETIGESDQNLAELIEEVRKQFFIKTANRPYIDRLAANNKVSRPRFVGMDDASFRKFIPVIAYQPKQVKKVLDSLLDVFFFKESTTAFTQALANEPYIIKDGSSLEYLVDGIKKESINFNAANFIDPNNATANEIAGAINKQAQHSFAVVFFDRISNTRSMQLFTNTVGSKGSVKITGGIANSSIQFTGFLQESGSTASTVWNITKIGDTTKFQVIAGGSTGLDRVNIGDIVIIDIPGNSGSFEISDVNLFENSFTFANAFSTPGIHSHVLHPNTSVDFMQLVQNVVYTQNNRAIVWETSPGQIIVEMPATPPVVRRQLAGSAHLNGIQSGVETVVDLNTLELNNAEEWPMFGGQFVLQNKNEIKSHILTPDEDSINSHKFNSRFDKLNRFSYTHKIDNILYGVTPNLPMPATIIESDIVTAARTNNILVVTTSSAHDLEVGNLIGITNTVSALSTVGVRIDIDVTDTASSIAEKTATKLNLLADFNASAISNVLTVQNSTNGISNDALDVSANVGIVVTQQGDSFTSEETEITFLDPATNFDIVGNGLQWEISNANNIRRYHIWYNVTDGVNLQSNPGQDDDINNAYTVISVISPTVFTVNSVGENGTSINGEARIEKIGLSEDGSLVYLTSAQNDTGIYGPYLWDPTATYVLSSYTSQIQQNINAGSIVRTLPIAAVNNIPNQEGFVIFGFGTESEEGPVRYFFKPSDSSLQLDPAYVFQNNHSIGDGVTVIRRRGAHILSSSGKELAPYITDPAAARIVLENLLQQTKSVGIFIEFLTRYPQQLYATLDVYRTGDPNLLPIDSE